MQLVNEDLYVGHGGKKQKHKLFCKHWKWERQDWQENSPQIREAVSTTTRNSPKRRIPLLVNNSHNSPMCGKCKLPLPSVTELSKAILFFISLPWLNNFTMRHKKFFVWKTGAKSIQVKIKLVKKNGPWAERWVLSRKMLTHHRVKFLRLKQKAKLDRHLK